MDQEFKIDDLQEPTQVEKETSHSRELSYVKDDHFTCNYVCNDLVLEEFTKLNSVYRVIENMSRRVYAALKLNVNVDPGRAITSYLDMSTAYSFGWIKRDGEWICNPEPDILALAPFLSPYTLTFLDVMHGLSSHLYALAAHVLDRYNLLNERISDLASRFLPPLDA
ncbi:hypothetical protein Gohar_017433 [Gossypium harknessii]|uniref:Uncharacterized protein n=1 Tax=Gossypium harknessii TaxID=34285 RepID=A0A7J9G790_9ROSI|nr:hypothetical protein [Gossypium harknessii]